jgi:hypothetical protein
MRFNEIQVGQKVRLKAERAEAYGMPVWAGFIYTVKALKARPGYKSGFVYLNEVDGAFKDSDFIAVK